MLPGANEAMLAALLGAAIMGAVALGGQFLVNRHQRQRDLRLERSGRMANLLAGSHAAVLALGILAQADMAEKAVLERDFRSGVDRMNIEMNAIRVLDPKPVVDAAQELDLSMLKLMNLVLDHP